MMKIAYPAVVLSVLSMLAFDSAVGQERPVQANREKPVLQSEPAAPNQEIYLGSKIIGADLRDPQDKKLGEIKELVLDSRRGEVAYVIVSSGGLMGMGGTFHPIPWKALQPSDDGKYYVLYADRETIRKAPGFEPGKWPDLADQKWSAEVESYWNKMVGEGPSGGIEVSSGVPGTGAGSAAGNDGNGPRKGQ